jgi:hypothetical protein
MTNKTDTTTTTVNPTNDAPQSQSAVSVYQQLRGHLAVLKLDAAAQALPQVLQIAAEQEWTMTYTLEHLLGIEVDATEARRLAGRLRFACLPTPATLDGFDYDAAPGVDRALIRELGTCAYLESATNVLLIGPPGTGKTHLAVGLAHAAVHAGYRTYVTTAARSGRALPQSRHRGPLGHLHAVLRRPHPAGDRRTRISTIAGRSRVSIVSSCGTTIFENKHRHHHQPVSRRMG